jgi:hypothetical protein
LAFGCWLLAERYAGTAQIPTVFTQFFTTMKSMYGTQTALEALGIF